MLIVITLSVIGPVDLTLVMGKICLTCQFNSEVKELFSQSKDNSDRTLENCNKIATNDLHRSQQWQTNLIKILIKTYVEKQPQS